MVVEGDARGGLEHLGGLVLAAEVLLALRGRALATLVRAALAAAVGPAKALGDGGLLAPVNRALGAAAVRPAQAARLGPARAAVDRAERGPAVLPAEPAVLGAGSAAVHGARLAAAVAEAQPAVDRVVGAALDAARARLALLLRRHLAAPLALLGHGVVRGRRRRHGRQERLRVVQDEGQRELGRRQRHLVEGHERPVARRRQRRQRRQLDRHAAGVHVHHVHVAILSFYLCVVATVELRTASPIRN